MDRFVINGHRKLSGEVSISGAKNAAVAIIPAAIMADDVCVIDNLPCIEDVSSFFRMMNKIGAKCEFLDRHTMKIDSRMIKELCATYEEVKEIRASYYLLGALLGRFGKAEVALPGGCDLGTRPIDQHIKGFRALGATVDIENGVVRAYADKLVGTSIYMDVVSVGATINVMLAATLAEGVTTIENAAKEPHIVDTANFLNKMGAKIRGAGTDVIRITGVEKLHGAEYTIIPDQIEAGTYMIAAAITKGDVLVKNVIPKHMETLTAKLIEMNVGVEVYDDAIRIMPTGKEFNSVNIKTMAYPGFPTDLQPQICALLCLCKGTGIITENVWDNRYRYIAELKRLGAQIFVEGKLAIVAEVPEFNGAEVEATDLRAGAAMVIAGLAAKGTTTISGIKYIDRGYEDIEDKLSALGADIKRVEL